MTRVGLQRHSTKKNNKKDPQECVKFGKAEVIADSSDRAVLSV
jgi:hypothetical protein